jgi:hypothetical protein
MILIVINVFVLIREIGFSRSIEIDRSSEVIRLLVGADIVGHFPIGAVAIRVESHTIRTARHVETLYQFWIEANGCRFCFVRAALERDKYLVLNALRHAMREFPELTVRGQPEMADGPGE